MGVTGMLTDDDGLPPVGFVRIAQIIGDPKAVPPIPAIIPISRSGWWAGVKSGRFPMGCHIGPRTTAWDVREIRTLLVKLSGR